MNENDRILAKDLMKKPVRRLTWKTTVPDAARFMLEWGISGAPVVDAHGRWSGVFTLRDLARHVQERLAKLPVVDPSTQRTLETREEIPEGFSFEGYEGTTVSELMTSGLYTVFPDATIEEVIRTLATQKIHRVFVIDDKGSELLGVITTMDLITQMDAEVRNRLERRRQAV